MKTSCPPGSVIDVEKISAMSVKAENLGFKSVWAWDHLLLGSMQVFPIIDLLSLLSYLAAKTSRIGLGTVYILPLRPADEATSTLLQRELARVPHVRAQAASMKREASPLTTG